jgi:hypothetical protein
MADTVDCADRTPANRDTEMTYLPTNSIQERTKCTGFSATGFSESVANLPPYDPLRL